MRIRDILGRLSKLDPDMDLNDLRGCLTTGRDETDELVRSINDDTDSWDELAAMLTKDAVIPMLLELRDLMLLPTSEKGWVKPAEMAKKVAEQVAINEARCQERIAEVEAHHEDAMRTAENEHRTAVAELTDAQEEQLAVMRRRHDLAVEGMERRHEEGVVSLKWDHTSEKERLGERISGMQSEYDELDRSMREALDAVPGKQADAVAKVLTDAADRLEAMGQMRLARLVKRRGSIFRSKDKDMDQMMLRVEADGILLSAKRLRLMSAEAAEQGVWPVEFADSDENSEEAQEALSRMLTPIRDPDADAAEGEVETAAEVEAD